MKKDTKASRKRNNEIARTLLIWIPILTALILALAQLLNALPRSVFLTPTSTPSRDCQYIALDTIRTSVAVSSTADEKARTLFRGVPASTSDTYLIDLEDSSSREIGKVKFQYDGELDQFEIITIVNPLCYTAQQAGESPLDTILLDNDTARIITIEEATYEMRLIYLRDKEEIQGSFLLK